MATSEIEKLERRYAENPQGLTFAPLAEVHRKNGDVARALELLRAGLELHPNYIPASIVLGRCHWDLGDLPAAEAAFAHVLRLDDENVIALKSLADINERLERYGEAQRWLHRLVSVDRSNEEARQQLTRLETVKERGDRQPTVAEPPPTAAKAPPAVEPIAAQSAAAPPRAAAPPSAAVPPPAAAAPRSAAAPSEPVPKETAPLDLTADIAEPAPLRGPSEPPREVSTKSSALEFLDTSEPSQAKGSELSAKEAGPVDGLISQEFVPPKEATYRLHPELTQEFISGRDLPEGMEVETSDTVELQSSGAGEFRVPNAAEDFLDLAARINAAREETPTRESSEPAPMEPAVPERYSIPEPPPARLEPPPARKETVSPRSEVPVPSPLGGLKLVTDSGPPAQSYAASDTKGQSVGSFFRTLLAARPAGNSGSSMPGGSAGAPAPNQDVQSLSAGETKDAAVSFDDFFGSAAGGATSSPPGSSDASPDDLDQFQSWLQNLKR